MINLGTLYFENLPLIVLAGLAFFSILFGFPRSGRNILFSATCFAIMLVLLAFTHKALFFINLALVFFMLWAFIFGLKVDRLYIYRSAIIFLPLSALSLIVGAIYLGEQFSIFAYLLLFMAVVKDILYEKLFEN